MVEPASPEGWAPPEPARGIRPWRSRGRPGGAALAALCLAAVAAAALIAALWWNLSWIAAAIFASLLLAAALAVPRWSASRALRKLGACPAEGEGGARLANLVSGIASDLGMTPPEACILEAAPANALVLKKGRGYTVAVSRRLLETATLTELEAVVAHCVVRIARGEIKAATVLSLLGRAGVALCPEVGPRTDAAAAALTRYPPGLVRALRRCTPVQGPLPALWFSASGPCHTAAEQRIRALEEL